MIKKGQLVKSGIGKCHLGALAEAERVIFFLCLFRGTGGWYVLHCYKKNPKSWISKEATNLIASFVAEGRGIRANRRGKNLAFDANLSATNKAKKPGHKGSPFYLPS